MCSRLLNRGSLSLLDSYLLLDGLAFSANLLDNKDLLHNPLALALESMRDSSDDVCMDIHPSATLSRIYFENILCLSRLSPEGRTEIGVHIALGDTDGPATIEMLIFGETHSLSTSTTPSLTIRVARITPATRGPCPDDPAPRKPPLHLLTSKWTIGELAANTRIKVDAANGKGEGSEVVRRAKEVMLHLPNSKLRGRGEDRQGNRWYIQSARSPAKKTSHVADGDVFGPVSDSKGKTRAVDEEISDIEQENKYCLSFPRPTHLCTQHCTPQIIKKFTVRRLDAVGVSKAHLEFKDIFGFVYRGTAFALTIFLLETKSFEPWRALSSPFHLGVRYIKSSNPDKAPQVLVNVVLDDNRGLLHCLQGALKVRIM
ncbi:uncharacterized protein EDB91DRAFT_1316386 [Suillus paluster]|uniref:uncharacterized protein n=1 Tax=Suillus paluster TaxID=48578 RepID=UPI001B88063F|nr:uncharacterized protein EDB91DRAFT_1316386 [Suillus paluster]KAG1726963.1 hypothetical protein EDB91DRAFT_1316386 [Suillus paluster]